MPRATHELIFYNWQQGVFHYTVYLYVLLPRFTTKIIANNTPDISELIVRGRGGLYFNPGSQFNAGSFSSLQYTVSHTLLTGINIKECS